MNLTEKSNLKGKAEDSVMISKEKKLIILFLIIQLLIDMGLFAMIILLPYLLR